MKNKKTDRRSLRTRQTLHHALFTLMQEKQYDTITVQNIIERADVGRSTFYAHFADKDDLAASNVEQILDQLTRNSDQDSSGGGEVVATLELFRHVQEQYPLFQTLMRSRGVDLFFEKGQAYWSKRVEAYLCARLPGEQKPSAPLPIVSNYIAGALVTLLKWWIDNKMPYSPEQMDAMFRRLALSSAQAALEDPPPDAPNTR